MSPSGLAKRIGPRPHHVQQIQARHGRRPRTLAFDRIGRQGARRHQFVDRHLRAVDRRRRAQPAIGAAARLRAGRQRRLFRRQRFSGRQGLGRGGAAFGQRRARLRAGDIRRFDEARLSRRRHHRGVAGHGDPARRPCGGEDLGRRSHGQGIEAPDRQDAGAAVAQSGPCRPHASDAGSGRRMRSPGPDCVLREPPATLELRGQRCPTSRSPVLCGRACASAHRSGAAPGSAPCTDDRRGNRAGSFRPRAREAASAAARSTSRRSAPARRARCNRAGHRRRRRFRRPSRCRDWP